ncbi:unnamed protein product [Didymodactylos carnosus]|uniref:N-terminal methionine N(alpha)-acetyltransferase NatC n=1 Tax=Didymodactylos carnosus TaxID=1234261 RepID=A0A813S161_9BILA|nr:unnamed protein product [Didymodactylos carnosus]CAF1315907.1 unnamed protein product [Didymodactylos carnosus]CAF3572772.1 unnamed protein product [Didymodactylos carnosus]CAF4124780.1 unnamed protein product [Didymodactylos carnosus]
MSSSSSLSVNGTENKENQQFDPHSMTNGFTEANCSCCDHHENSLHSHSISQSPQNENNIEEEQELISRLQHFTLDTINENCDQDIYFHSYKSEEQMLSIMKLISGVLSEPYSIYTYRYFIHNWPELCFLCSKKSENSNNPSSTQDDNENELIGSIVCKLDLHKKILRRGYIAMLAVNNEYRRKKIASKLVCMAIQTMMERGCDEIVLEAEVTNQAALNLYENLGFLREKRLYRYYLNGVDAYRLKLWLK